MNRILSVGVIGLSAFLLFQVEPMIAKIILPRFGGGSTVWITALIFFQGMLFFGYAASHGMARLLSPRARLAVYGAAFTVCAVFFLPITVSQKEFSGPPALSVLLLLLGSVGLSYFILSTTSPMIQYFSAVDKKGGLANPYVQYAVSNFGSFAGLLSYPLFIEPKIGNSRQMLWWSLGFGLYALLMMAAVVLHARLAPSPAPAIAASIEGTDALRPSAKARLSWLFQAAVPSAALLAFTQHLTVDLVSFPLLWILPLCLYLLSFVAVFLFPRLNRHTAARTIILILALAVFAVSDRRELDLPFAIKIFSANLALFSACLFFHGNLEREKPRKTDLTSFYLWLSLGGWMGGLFGGIAAPFIFRTTFELQLIFIISLYAMLFPHLKAGTKTFMYSVSAAAALFLLASYAGEEIFLHHPTLRCARSFYGTYRVIDVEGAPGQMAPARLLVMGTTKHGGQVAETSGKLIPMSYFHVKTGAGLALLSRPFNEHVGVVGLGTGVLALYGRPGETYDFYEIDPLVKELAETSFQNLSESRAKVRHFIGDARLKLRDAPDKFYDILFLDAFTSGAIPTHLLTVEAISEFLGKVKDNGLILCHISNRFVDLLPVLACNAEKLNLQMAQHISPENEYLNCYSAHWVALARNRAVLDALTATDPAWQPAGKRVQCFTDDFSHLFSLVHF